LLALRAGKQSSVYRLSQVIVTRVTGSSIQSRTKGLASPGTELTGSIEQESRRTRLGATRIPA
jgi:hypothetical protein